MILRNQTNVQVPTSKTADDVYNESNKLSLLYIHLRNKNINDPEEFNIAHNKAFDENRIYTGSAVLIKKNFLQQSCYATEEYEGQLLSTMKLMM